MLAPGDTAPDFTLPDQNGDPVTLSALRGQTVVIYFYPKADTPGCTTQACGVRDHRDDYEAAGAAVFGVSPDSVKDVAKFEEKFSLGFPLLADEDNSVAEAYGVWVEKSMYGRRYMGNERTTFVIGPDGLIQRVLRKVKPAEHDELVLGVVRAAGVLEDSDAPLRRALRARTRHGHAQQRARPWLFDHRHGLVRCALPQRGPGDRGTDVPLRARHRHRLRRRERAGHPRLPAKSGAGASGGDGAGHLVRAVSTSAGIGIAARVAWGIGGWSAWRLGGWLPTWAYLAVAALEIALSRGLHEAVGEVRPEDR